ncbi:P-loop containing nucleoside triphosphate hydrolase protein, partial [Baffinella frigidus]
VASSSPSSGALGVGEAARFDALHKRFPARGQEIVGTVAVKDMSLGVARGECLALLGTNGAGKSTSLAVFLRQYHPSTGGAYIGGLNVNSASSDQLFGEVGYCPQGNAIFEFLSGREVLRFHAAARGLYNLATLDGPDGYIQFWLSRIVKYSLSPVREMLGGARNKRELHVRVLCGKYSGGNKRKLCMAIAFMGDPSLVVLDEPSAGVDPAARKKMWATISESRRPAGGDAAAKGGTGETTVLLTTQFMDEGGTGETTVLLTTQFMDEGGTGETTVLLTTQFMDEADALGTRIGIMVAGQLSCLGTSQALKTRFGSGYDLEIKMKDGSSIADVLPIVQ